MSNICHSFTDDTLGELDATGVTALTASKELTPGEVLAASIERSRRVAPHIYAVVEERYEQALAALDLNYFLIE